MQYFLLDEILFVEEYLVLFFVVFVIKKKRKLHFESI